MTALTFGLGPDATEELISKVVAASAFQSASRKIYVPGNGAATPVLGAVEAGWVNRGEAKKVSTPSTETVTLMPYQLAVIIPVSNELLEDDKSDLLEKEIINQGVGALARKFDRAVAGLDAAPGSDFFTFQATDSVQVTDRASFIAALAEVANAGAIADSFVLSNSLFFELMGATLSNGTPVFDIRDGRINGIEYHIISGVSEKIGVLGAFKTNAVWGTVSDVHVKITDTGSYHEGGELKSAFETNVTAIRVEGRFGFQVSDADAFVKVEDEETGS